MECTDVTKLRHQHGFSLTEALVAFSVVAIGLLAVATFQSGLFSESAYNKARMEALALAQQKIEQLKHYTQADETAYIDENGDGVMDADGTYTDNDIVGQNAVFQRSWALGTVDLGKDVVVTVAWTDADNQQQAVSLASDIPWISPRTSADQIAGLTDPWVDSPTGRAKLGEGRLADIPTKDLISFPNIYPGDGLEMYQHDDNLLLANSNGDILLTLLEACSTTSGDCKDFVRIAGTVYLDTANLRMSLEDIKVLASDAAHCARWVPDGTLASPPTTPSGDYEYFHYTCYLGGGWHGNIGFVTTAGLQLTDKVCQGDPTAFDEWEQPVIALRRAYRGMISKSVSGTTKYFSHGIKDAARITGQDFVFTALSSSATEGYHCSEIDAPMTRLDSSSGKLFTDVPTDFVCLNLDEDSNGSPDYLDAFDTSEFSAGTTCPYDPTSPPVLSHTISGSIDISAAVSLDLSDFEVLTTDGPGNCAVELVAGYSGRYSLGYQCTVYDWGRGWTGGIVLKPNSPWLYCPKTGTSFTDLTADGYESFYCVGGPTITIEGPITYLVSSPIDSMTIQEAVSGNPGYCEFLATKYRCIAPYDGSAWSGKLAVNTFRHVCDSTDNAFSLADLTLERSPYYLNLVVALNDRSCPVETL
jgi:Tfp pilus assembly protein PilV